MFAFAFIFMPVTPGQNKMGQNPIARQQRKPLLIYLLQNIH
jgi:hypothetical protein